MDLSDGAGTMKLNDLYRETGFANLLWRYIWGPVNLLCAFVPLLFLNFLQFPSLILLPFSVKAFRAYQRGTCFLVWGWWAWSVRKIVGLEVVFSGDKLPSKENAIIVCNHQGMADIVMILCLSYDQRHVANLKWFVKDALKWVPGLGWGMVFAESVFLKRSWHEDADRVNQSFANIVKHSIPVQLAMFPEGTRFTQAKLEKNNEYAKEQGLEPTRHVLFPRTKGFVASMAGLETHVPAVYSLTIAYEGRVPTLVEAIRGDIKRAHVHVRRFTVDSLPTSDKERSQWLKDEFYFKDRLLAGFHTRGGRDLSEVETN
jgi:1-acyl-sn-glycerol-3-phosphate acyltransferase